MANNGDTQEKETEMEITILLNGEIIDIISDKNEKLCKIREHLINSLELKDNFVFLKDNKPLRKNLEKTLTVVKIMDTKSNEIYLKITEENLSAPKPLLDTKTPINGSIEINPNENKAIKYFKYPKIEFTSEEENKSKVVLLVGKTGVGKSTFVNALVNVYSGIKISDKFRYLLINDENVDQQKSVTQEISIFNIRAKEGLNFPPLKIIDTPGFGDTEGIEKDLEHIKKFQEIFENQLVVINCICFVVKAAEIRVDFHQKYIFNNIMNLFAENVKDNFIVEVTNFSPYKENEIPNIIEHTLSVENSFYYQNVLKKSNMSREEILKTDWYFASNNKIIFDNEIENNKREALNFEETEEKIIYFINKLKNLESKIIKESSNVIKKRIESQIQIEGLTEKMDRLNDNKKRHEFNKKEQENYLNDILKQEKLILDIEKEKERNIINTKNMNEMNTLLEIEMKRNNEDREQKLKKYRIMSDKLEFLKKELNSTIKRKKKLYREKQTETINIVCKKCNSNCHINYKCILFKYFCGQFNFIGDCRICKCGLSDHIQNNFIFEQYDEEILENKNLINSMNEELRKMNKIINNLKKDEENLSDRNLKLQNEKNERNEQKKQLDNKQQEESNYINSIEGVIKNLKNEKNIVNNKIEKLEGKIKEIELEIIQILGVIKNNLEYLRKNSLNKEFNKTMDIYIDERIKVCEKVEDFEQKEDLLKIRKIYKQLIEIENIDVSELTLEKYEEIKKKILL